MGNFENRVRDIIRREDVQHIFPANDKEMVSKQSDLPDVESGFHQLEDGTTYFIDGQVTSEYGIEHNGSSMLRGLDFRNDQFVYTGTGVAHRTRGDEFFYRDLTTVAPSGTMFDLDGQDNAEAEDDKVEMLVLDSAFQMSADLGTIEGYKVPSFKGVSFDQWDEGITFTGSPNKVLLSGCPFRTPDSGATQAVLFDSSFTTDFIDISGGFFKRFGGTVDAINFNGTLNKSGIIAANLFEDDTINDILVNFDKTSVGWQVSNNSGLQDSRVAGIYTKDGSSATDLGGNADTYTKITGATTAQGTPERLSHTSPNTFTYTGKDSVTVSVTVSITLDGAADNFNAAVFKNQSAVPGGDMTWQGSGVAVPVNAVVLSEVDLTTGDEIEIYIKNEDSGDNDPTIDDMQVRVLD